MTDAGALVATKQYIGESVTNFAQASARLGIGDSTTAFAKPQTDLAAATNKLRKAVDSPPVRTLGVIRWSATFGSAEAAWDWREWGVFNAGPTGGDMLVRKVETPTLGAKPSGQTWQLVVDVAFAAGP